jgi:hypothetical protein
MTDISNIIKSSKDILKEIVYYRFMVKDSNQINKNNI